MAGRTERGIPLSALSPKFLHTNSTSHTWPFSAIAELIDNAYDPDVSARQFWIDKTRIRDQDCLTFMDNGAGMDYDKMYKMLSFGFSDKETKNGHAPIGLYGNGFKSGSMRLGKDAIVFSKKGETMCVGMLSQTYLQEIQVENVIVPIVTFKCIGESIRPESQHTASLKDILQYSLFKTEEELLAELRAINAYNSRGTTGTRIIIWNLRKTSSDKSEFDFEVDRYDIQIPADVYESEKETYKQSNRVLQSSPESDFSLQAYCSVLYLKPRMQINIRGQKVKTQLISKSLACVDKDYYKPKFLNKKIPITFGYNTKSKEHYGVMMYHKNRLIKAYERVGCQNKANKRGVGVIAVIECNFLNPTHNKQDFDYTEDYRRTMQALDGKLEEYWKAIQLEKGRNSKIPVEDIPKRPDQNWVQCDDCQKWRKLPDGYDTDKLPDKWFCRMNPNTEFRGCDKPEESEDSDDEISTRLKVYKQHEKTLKKQEQEQKKMKGPSSPKSASTPRSPVDFRPLPQSASTSSDNMPVITEVMSLSPFSRRKRSLGERTENPTLKKARALKEYCSNTANSPSTSNLLTSQMEIPDSVDKEDEEGISDDDVVIDETKSTPRAKPSTFNLDKVKLERTTSNDGQISDHVSMETPVEDSNINATSDPSVSSGLVSMTTQTECRTTVKVEVNQQGTEKVEIKKEDTENDTTEMEHSNTAAECKDYKKTEMNNEESMEIERCRSADIVKPGLAAGSDRKTEVTSLMSEKAASMNSVLNIDHIPSLEAQEQQDSLLELMNSTADERDEYKLKAQSLTLELEQKELQLLDLTFKKEFNHQIVQTDPVEEQDYKTLYLEAKRHNEQLMKTINELKKKKEEALLQMKAEKEAADRMKAEGAGHSASADMEDEIALQVDFLLRELDQRNTQFNDLKIKLDSLEQERARCEQLQKELEDLRKNQEECRNETASSTQRAQHCNTLHSGSANHVNQIKEDREPSERPAGGENIATNVKLSDLRRRVARLLVTFVPALDLEQVNYDCEVIDEILNQVIQEIPPPESTST